jgi:type VI secretion system protein ImpK
MREFTQDVNDAEATVVLPTPGRRRNVFAPDIERHAAAADLSALGGLNRLIEAANPILAAVAQIRHALRHPDPAGLHARVRAQIDAFERVAHGAGLAEKQVEVARFALCALLDDSAAATPWSRAWAACGLLAQTQDEEAAGERFFVLLDKLMAAPAAHIEALEFLYVCLALGFEGRYRSGEGGRQALTQIRARVLEALAPLRPPVPRELSEGWRGTPIRRRRLPGVLVLWSLACAGALVLAALYFAYRVSLGELSDPVARELARLQPIAIRAVKPLGLAVSARSRELAQAIARAEVEVSETSGGSLIVLKADELFASGSARLHGELHSAVLRIAEVLDRTPGTIVVTGHTDDLPIRTARFPSNWELSTERARSVVALMASRLRDATRLTAEGVADSEPLMANDSAAHRAKNRRVAIIVRTAS